MTFSSNNRILIFRFSGSSQSKEAYGLAPIFKKAIAMKELPASAPLTVPVKDRIVNQEAILLAFMAENTLPFTIAPQNSGLGESYE